MNRRHRRAAQRTRAARLANLAALSCCPDCDSTVEIEKVTERIHNAIVRHDDTCPWLLAFESNGGLGVRFTRQEDCR